MLRRRTWCAAFGLCCTGWLTAQAPMVAVEIQTAQRAVRNHQDFTVSTSVRNIGSQEQSLEMLSCSYPQQWTADDPAVRIPPAACKKDGLIPVKLKPGEAYQRELPVRIEMDSKNRDRKAVTFRLGFEPANRVPGPQSPIIWGNAITVGVTE